MELEFLLVLLLSLNSVSGDDTNPLLRIDTSSEEFVTFFCETSMIIPNVDMYLKCPLSEGYCFHNCDTFCSEPVQNCPNMNILNGIRCTRRKMNNQRLIVSYTISRYEPKIKGKWFCSYNGVNTIFIEMNSSPRPIPSNIGRSIRKPSNIKSAESDDSTKESDSKSTDMSDSIFKGELVITVIILLLISLILNLAFCIRCCLIRKYIKMFKKNKLNKTTCLELCLCVKNKRRESNHRRNSYTNSGTYDNNIPLNNARPGSNYSYPVGNNVHDVLPPMMTSTFDAHPAHSTSPSTPQVPHHHMINTQQAALSNSAVLIPTSMTPEGQILYRVQPAVTNSLTGSATALRTSQTLYDDVPGEHSPASSQLSAPNRASSLNSLYAKPKRFVSPNVNRLASPLPEETNTLLLQHQKSNQNDQAPSVQPSNQVLNGFRASTTDDESSSLQGSESYSGAAIAARRHDIDRLQRVHQMTGRD